MNWTATAWRDLRQRDDAELGNLLDPSRYTSAFMTDSTPRVIAITGAASGMGRETARRFSREGWLVAAYDVDEKNLDSLREELGDRLITRTLDVTNKADFDRAMAQLSFETDCRLDVLFNNAGIGQAGWFEDVPYEATRRLVEVNFIGVLNGIYSALPLLRATAGSLCFSTSSSAAIFGMARIAVYSATKFAIKGLTEALSVEFDRLGVRVADVLPGLIDTPILDNTPNHSDPDARFGDEGRAAAPTDGPFRLVPPSEVAECVWRAYHDTTGRLHWYVPEELEAIEQARAGDVGAVRNQYLAMLQQRLGGQD